MWAATPAARRACTRLGASGLLRGHAEALVRTVSSFPLHMEPAGSAVSRMETGTGVGARADTSWGLTRLWPSVRRLLTESGLDPATIIPSGPRGTLVKGDVLAAMGLCAPPMPSRAAAAQVITPADVVIPVAAKMTTAAPRAAATMTTAAPLAAREDEASPYDDVRVTSVRKIIAARLLESKTTNPHEYFTADVSLAGVATLRAELKAAGVRASVNDCVVYAASRALAASPKVNATWDDAKVGPALIRWPAPLTHALADPRTTVDRSVDLTHSLPSIDPNANELLTRVERHKLCSRALALSCSRDCDHPSFAVL
mmetsp:Transcript_39309/g.62959  ORF Transcript_39309/g.62959 Transcript_39309/m.62959 type:complete len:314 (+) Transcript_39309:72-1013(+)